MRRAEAFGMAFRCALLVLALIAPQASAFELRRDSTGEIVRWVGTVTFVIDEESFDEWGVDGAKDATLAAIRTIAEASPGASVTGRVGRARAFGYDVGSPPSNQNDIIVLHDWPYLDGTLAATVVTVNARTHEILDADIAINAEQHRFAVLGSSPRADRDDVQNTLTHELGHAMGLMHNMVDEEVVMFPAAPKGEISKRTLAADDQAGLSSLYAPAEPVPSNVFIQPMGCSSSAASAPWWLSLVALVALARRRFVAAPVVLVLAALPAAASDGGAALALKRSDTIGVATVSSLNARRVGGLIVTDVSLSLSTCLQGACDAQTTVTLPGGKLGELEQSLIDHPLPGRGDSLLLVKADGKLKVRALDVEGTPAVVAALKQLGLTLRSPSTATKPLDPAPVSQSPSSASPTAWPHN